MLPKVCNNESGFILVLALAMLIVLSLIGVAGTRTSVIDLKISGNERSMSQEFNLADSLWQLGALWINYQDGKPDEVNITRQSGDSDETYETGKYYKIVRNFGNGGDGDINTTFQDGTQDGTIAEKNFWYRVICWDATGRADGNDDTVQTYPVDIEVVVNGRTQVGARVVKNWRE